MKERIRREVEPLRETYPNTQHGQNLDWVMIPDFPLPGGWNRNLTRLLFLIPTTYPHSAPDNFYVDSGLRLSDGRMPANYNEGQSVPIGGAWGCFSWHPEKWNPSDEILKGDNLLTFMKSVRLRLRELS